MSLTTKLTQASLYISKTKLYEAVSDVWFTVFCRLPTQTEKWLYLALRMIFLFIILLPLVEHLGLLFICENLDITSQEVTNYCCTFGREVVLISQFVSAFVGASLIRVVVELLHVAIVAFCFLYVSAAFYGCLTQRRLTILCHGATLFSGYYLTYAVWSISADQSVVVTELTHNATSELLKFTALLWPVWVALASLMLLPIGLRDMHRMVVTELCNLWFGVIEQHTEAAPPSRKSNTLVLFVHGGGFLCGTTAPQKHALELSYSGVKTVIERFGVRCELIEYPLRKTPVGVLLILFGLVFVAALVTCAVFSLLTGHAFGWFCLAAVLFVSACMLIKKHLLGAVYCDSTKVQQVDFVAQAAIVQSRIREALDKHKDAETVLLIGHSGGATLALNAYTSGISISIDQPHFSRIQALVLLSGVYDCERHCADLPAFFPLYGERRDHFKRGPCKHTIQQIKSTLNSSTSQTRVIFANTGSDLRISEADSTDLHKGILQSEYFVLENLSGHCTAPLFTEKCWASVFEKVLVKVE